ncbi:Alpha (1,3)-fucosyltransferase [Helicobacter pylori BM012A]|uniref:Alpha-(1,3)-fucosyltransferase n=1 Tax=Helicobacter pylori BM012S TaxID=1407463 RepID=V5NPJ6_HELPX|nr:glycosyltransferase family 10 [Helicobacter pylori]AHA88720.1 Alpha (1,3)-fucosyltransferase [Helicobacter pylori BM012A]AHA90294.1 Alpha (1,3)-fucosyltransferase [Helicobacter pylori BM012S]
MFQPLLDAFIESAPIKKITSKSPPLKIAVANWWGGAEEFKKSALYFILSQRYKITLHQNPKKHADIVFGNPLGSARKILSYQNAKRVFYTGENEVPNFNLFDYAIGFDELDFNNRYLRMPLYYDRLHHKAESVNDTTAPYKLKDNSLYALKKPSHKFKENHPNLCALINNEIDPLKRGFASFVASNANAPIRNAFYDALNSIEPVTGGGSVRNTLGYKVKNKSEFLSQYKFNLCFENSQGYGYVTEKIIDAYFSHTIPIYWGSPSVAKDFNPKSFVNVHDFNNFDEAIDYVRYLHTHPNAYLDMLYENPLNTIDGKAYFYQDLSFKKILDFFKTILENDTIYHKSSTSFMWERDLHNPLASIDDLRVNYDDLRVNYDDLRVNYDDLRVNYDDLRVNYDDLRVNYDDLRADYDRLLQNASPLLELSQNTTFKIYRKIYQKSLPLLRAVRKLVKKLGL